MDFSLVQQLLQDRTYTSASEAIADLRLVFENCRAFNKPTVSVVKYGNNVDKFMMYNDFDILSPVWGALRYVLTEVILSTRFVLAWYLPLRSPSALSRYSVWTAAGGLCEHSLAQSISPMPLP